MARLFASCPRGHSKVLITYGVAKNTAHNGGFLPVFRINRGKWSGHTYGRGLDRDVARRQVKALAHDEAERYGGDYCVAIRSVARPVTQKRRR